MTRFRKSRPSATGNIPERAIGSISLKDFNAPTRAEERVESERMSWAASSRSRFPASRPWSIQSGCFTSPQLLCLATSRLASFCSGSRQETRGPWGFDHDFGP